MAIALRADCDAARLRQAARNSEDAGQVRRLLALAAIYDGASRAQAAQMGGVTRQIVRDWVLRFNAEGADGLIDRKAPGKSALLGPAEREALAKAIEDGPLPAIDGVVRWCQPACVTRLPLPRRDTRAKRSRVDAPCLPKS